MKNIITNYESPSIKIIEVKIEKGFASSGDVSSQLEDWEIENW